MWVVGSTMIDMITYANRIPTAGETLVGDRFDLGFGGKGANQAVMAARLGARVSVVNAVGADVFADMTIENFRQEGIDVRHIARIDGESSGVAPIWVEPDGTNRILIVPGANYRMDSRAAEAAIAGAVAVDVVLGQLEIPQPVTAAAFRAAKGRGATTILNPAPAADLLPALLEVADWLVPNEVEFEHLARTLGTRGDDPTDAAILRESQEAAGAGLVVTLGAAGASAVSDQGLFVRVLAPTVTAVDTTGAGDAFVGAFAVALASGADLRTAVGLACACATDSVRRPGTQKSFPSPEEAGRIAKGFGLATTSR